MAISNFVLEEVASDSSSKIETISVLAKAIWEQHYIPIIGVSQVAYMLKEFQSIASIRDQLLQGSKYFIAYDEEPIGYLCLENRSEHLFISKIYLKHNSRGNGFGQKMILVAEEYAHRLKLPKLQLTVNIHNNSSIEFYKKIGFEITQKVMFDIGNNFVMDDYEMVKSLT